MNKISILSVLGLSAALLSAGAAEAASTSSAVSAQIVASISISNSVGLNFGQIAPTVAIGAVTVATTGIRNGTGGVTLAGGTPPTASSFQVSGAPVNTYSITLPGDTDVTLTAAAGAPMTVTGFVSDPDASGTLSGAGTDTVLVGATLNVGVSQATNPYSGTFNVTVAYN